MRLRKVAACTAAIIVLPACSSGGTRAAKPSSHTTVTSPRAPTRTSPTHAPTTASLRIGRATWQLPSGRAREVVLPEVHALLVVAGLDAAKASTPRVWHVALGTGETTRLGLLPQSVHDAAGARLGDDVFVFGGGAATTVATVQRYRAGGAAIVGSLPQPRSDLVAATIGNTAYILGGFDGARGAQDVIATTDGAHFRTVARLPQDVRYPAVAVSGGKIWLFGGEHGGNNVTSVQVIDPVAGTARVTGALPETLAHATAVVVGGHVLIAGGRHDGQILDELLSFDIRSRTTTQVGTLPYPVADAGGAVVDGVGYVVGGETPAVTASAVTLQYR